MSTVSRSSGFLIGLLLVTGAPLACSDRVATPRVYELATLNTDQIRALDRTHTVIVVPGGIMEEHGPYLPSYSDGYQNARYTADLASAIASRPGWTAVVFPAIPLGSGGANQIGGKPSFPGTFAVRPETLRSIFMDLGDEFGEQGFRWIFLVHIHGGPEHNRALDDACDYFRDTYGGRMVNLGGLDTGSDPGVEAMKASVSKEVLDEDALSLHAGLLETSRVMAVRPDLVPSAVAQAPSIPAREFPERFRIAAGSNWPGYFGAPRHATREIGQRVFEGDARWLISIATSVLDGQADERKIARVSALIQNADVAKALEPSMQRDAATAKRQREWIAARGKP